ncbi:YqaA family protein, partial [Campylobacter coli]
DIFALGLGFVKYPFIKACFFINLGKLSRYIFIIFIANSL